MEYSCSRTKASLVRRWPTLFLPGPSWAVARCLLFSTKGQVALLQRGRGCQEGKLVQILVFVV